MSYDSNARRDTPLARAFHARLKREGWMGVGEYVWNCLDDKTHGYYRNRPAIGANADFITAPEISQVFGELIGLWCAVVWQQMGCPKPFRLIEIGPGRGTMICDALRAMRVVSGLLEAVTLVLIDVDRALIKTQQATLAGTPVNLEWLASLDDLRPGGATAVLANEYLDTRGILQYVLKNGAVYERTVELDGEGRLVFGHKSAPEHFDMPRLLQEFGDVKDGTIFEAQPNHEPTATLKRLAIHGQLAALFIDYGDAGPQDVSAGDTLQAVRQHRYEHPLTSPGEADLSTQVNFTPFARNALDLGLTVDGPTTQAEFLGRLGIVERASKLMAANPALAGDIETGVARLMAGNGMGTRFKVIGIRSPDVPPLPGF